MWELGEEPQQTIQRKLKPKPDSRTSGGRQYTNAKTSLERKKSDSSVSSRTKTQGRNYVGE